MYLFPRRQGRTLRLMLMTILTWLATQIAAFAQTLPGGNSCNAGLFTNLGSAIVGVMNTAGLPNAGIQACGMAYMAMILIVFIVIAAGFSGIIRAAREDDISLFIKPIFIALAIATTIVVTSNIFL